MSKKPHILDYNLSDWEKYMIGNGEKKFRAVQVFEWLHQKLEFDPENFSNISAALKEKIKNNFEYRQGKIINRQEGSDSTEKILIEFADEKSVEAVLLKNGERITVCASTQAGCSLYCDFCLTAKTKFAGNLSTGQILEQIYSFAKSSPQRISNIVFMGMGEPFMNYENTLKAAHLLNDHMGINIGVRKITISTAGVLPGIKRFMEENQPFNIALSLHTLKPDLRSKLMDAEKNWPIEKVLSYLEETRYQRPKNKITFEYIMISNMNMSKEDAGLLAKACRRVGAKVSLIPLNYEYDDCKRPDENEISRFWQNIKDEGIEVFNRASQGFDILAACGMLKCG